MSCAKWLNGYINDILVETGSGGGDGIGYGLQYGFKEIHSIEIDKNKYNFCVRKFKGNKNVYLYCGDSLSVLPSILYNIKVKSTFLLDAHVSDVKQVHGNFICPILEELKLITRHSNDLGIKHTILIDDAKYFTGSFAPFGNIKLSDIKKTIFDISPSYIVKVGGRSISAT